MRVFNVSIKQMLLQEAVLLHGDRYSDICSKAATAAIKGIKISKVNGPVSSVY